MPEINPLTNNQIFLKKIAENTGSDYDTGDVSEINPLTIDQILLKEIAANTAEQSGDITELKGKVTANAEAIEATQDMISDAYDSTHTYNVGDYCIYENALYKCNTASTTGTWDSSKWDAVTVADELGELTERVEQSEFVSVGTDGVKTQKQLMQDLYALVDVNKITMQSKLVLNNANSLSFYPLNEQALDNRFICFMRTAVSSASGEVIETYQLGVNTAYTGKAYGGVEHETSSEVLSAGMSFTVFY